MRTFALISISRGGLRESRGDAGGRASGRATRIRRCRVDKGDPPRLTRIPLIETVAQDVRHALRVLCHHRGFTAVAVLSLALGIGATTAVFSVMNAVMLRPLAVKDAGELVLFAPERNNERFLLFNPEFEAIAAQQRSLSGMFAVSERPYLRVEFPAESPTYVVASLVAFGSYFDVLGITPAAGRLLTSSDDVGSADDAIPRARR